MDRTQLIRSIRDEAYIEGDFTLRSGRKSSYIIDKYAFETRPQLLAAIARLFAERLPEGTGRLAGVELGGVPLVVALALRSDLPYVIVRKNAKQHGLDRPFEGAMESGDHIALIEDVTTTGGAAIDAAGALLEAGAREVTVLAVVDRMEGATEAFDAAGLDFRPLFTREDLNLSHSTTDKSQLRSTITNE